MCIYSAHTYIHAYTHTHTYIHTYACAHAHIHTYIHKYIHTHTHPKCPTCYRTRHFFNNFTTNEDIAMKFEADLPHCARNVTTS